MSSVSTGSVGTGRKNLVLTAMIFAVAMTFIDQTIVSIAAPKIQSELGLSSTGMQWAVNSYLLTMAALFAYGGRLADTVGHRKMVTIGVIVFAGASALCGLTPKGSLAETWIVAFRALQGVGGAIMYPAALAIVVNTYELRERGRALALFFGIAGGLTAVGPLLGGYLSAWTWRAIFWVNIPIALIALVLIVLSKPETRHRPAPMDYRGLVLIAAGVALSVFGFQQSNIWGWSNPGIGLSIGLGLLLLVVFFRYEKTVASPLMNVSIFNNRAFVVQNVILGVAMMVFVPMFFFASEYAAVGLDEKPSQAGESLLYFFLGFVVAAQIGGRMLDRVGAKRPVVIGCAVAAVGFYLWAQRLTTLDFNKEMWMIVIAGAGMGLMMGPANTDAVNRASSLSYGEATGITQTVRNYGSSLSLAILGTVMVTETRSHLVSSLTAQGLTHAEAVKAADANSGTGSGGSTAGIPHFVRLDFARATQTVFYIMAGVMAVACLVALFGLRRGLQEQPEPQESDESAVTAA
ncbi:MFS transporter [Streptacidiphilus sp. N1-10]|uniref:MFS transporter n=1 Tax=Streptacidiphilus jeojiensis TaxID=3229225 RepID=A0ABV6XYH5_9ACTN